MFYEEKCWRKELKEYLSGRKTYTSYTLSSKEENVFQLNDLISDHVIPCQKIHRVYLQYQKQKQIEKWNINHIGNWYGLSLFQNSKIWITTKALSDPWLSYIMRLANREMNNGIC